MKFERIFIAPHDQRNASITDLYDINRASWIWHPENSHVPEGSSVIFELEYENTEILNEVFHISADNRYEFFIDGTYIGMGPDRSDLAHWSFASYRITLPPGKHKLEAHCRYYRRRGDWPLMPLAQLMYWEPGFIFAVSEENLRCSFNTGTANWKARNIRGLDFIAGGWATGAGTKYNVAEYNNPDDPVDAVEIFRPLRGNVYGCREYQRRLYPSNLPDQTRTPFDGKIKLRAVVKNAEGNRIAISSSHVSDDVLRPYRTLERAEKTIIPPNTVISFLLDFGTYLCAYPVITGSGVGTSITASWSESLFAGEGAFEKGHRDEIVNKTFRVETQIDEFENFTSTPESISPIWWRAGRYFMITFRTNDKEFVLEKLDFLESRYPFEAESTIEFSDPDLEKIMPMMTRVLQSCMHETYMDCPYYEQLMYVGDTRLEALATYALASDARLQKRAIDIYDWSRSEWNGLVAEHFPGAGTQLSGTFSMIWPLMVRDYMMYRPFENQDDFKRLRLSVRSMLVAISEYVNDENLIENLPGWSFVDWLEGVWHAGIPTPSLNKGKSSIFTLHYLLSLKAAMELEDFMPEPGGAFKQYYSEAYERSRKAVIDHFFVSEKSLFADDPAHTSYSCHAQCLAILADVLDLREANNCLFAMLDSKEILKPTVYFIHYLFETLKKMGFGEKILNYKHIWTDMYDLGAVTTWEMPEPTRSDCHAWGSHLFHHYFASIAGIQSAAPGFAKVKISPSFGTLTKIKGKMVHPGGFIEFDLEKPEDGRVKGRIVLPEGCTGKFACSGHGKLLSEGENII